MRLSAFPWYSLSYIAGLFDGEGSVIIKIVRDFSRVGSNPCFALRVQIVNTNKVVLEFVKEIFGGSIRKFKRTFPNKVVYYWSVNGLRAAGFLKSVFPYLIIKFEEAILGIFFQLNKDKVGMKGPKVRSMDKFNEEKYLYQELKEMHRG